MWCALAAAGLTELTHSVYSPLSTAAAARILTARQHLGVSGLRLLPKRQGLRPIAKLSRPSTVRVKLHKGAAASKQTAGVVSLQQQRQPSLSNTVQQQWNAKAAGALAHGTAAAAAAAAACGAATGRPEGCHGVGFKRPRLQHCGRRQMAGRKPRRSVRVQRIGCGRVQGRMAAGRAGCVQGLAGRTGHRPAARQVASTEVLSFRAVNKVLEPAFQVRNTEHVLQR